MHRQGHGDFSRIGARNPVVREVERKDFFLTTNNIHVVQQTLIALLVRRRLRSSESKNLISLQFNESSNCTIQARRGGNKKYAYK